MISDVYIRPPDLYIALLFLYHRLANWLFKINALRWYIYAASQYKLGSLLLKIVARKSSTITISCKVKDGISMIRTYHQSDSEKKLLCQNSYFFLKPQATLPLCPINIAISQHIETRSKSLINKSVLCYRQSRWIPLWSILIISLVASVMVRQKLFYNQCKKWHHTMTIYR